MGHAAPAGGPITLVSTLKAYIVTCREVPCGGAFTMAADEMCRAAIVDSLGTAISKQQEGNPGAVGGSRWQH